MWFQWGGITAYHKGGIKMKKLETLEKQYKTLESQGKALEAKGRKYVLDGIIKRGEAYRSYITDTESTMTDTAEVFQCDKGLISKYIRVLNTVQNAKYKDEIETMLEDGSISFRKLLALGTEPKVKPKAKKTVSVTTLKRKVTKLEKELSIKDKKIQELEATIEQMLNQVGELAS